jgi:glutamine synthetase
LLHAARFGVDDEMEPPSAQEAGADPNTDVKIPSTLEEALTVFERDRALCDALGQPLVTAFTMLKRAEWERYAAAVTQPSTTEVTAWELEYYLPFF